MSIENDDTQPLDTRVPRWMTGLVPHETFGTYLCRHHLDLLQAARAAALPLALVWRAAHWLPISEQKARHLVMTLAQITGETFAGFLLTNHSDTKPHVTRFLNK